MNAKKAKAIRRMARDEMSNDGVPDRELVIVRGTKGDRVVNDPSSVRAMAIAIKKEYKKASQAGRI